MGRSRGDGSTGEVVGTRHTATVRPLRPVRWYMTDGPVDPADRTLDDLVSSLADHLTATASRPVDPKTNRWLGEAEAVARDAAESDLDAETTRERVRHVARLLREADETGDDEADAHVARARECCRAVLDE